jgi:hypothetical protein
MTMVNAPGPAEEFVLIYDAPTQTASELVCAALQAAGIRAVVQNEHRGPAAGWLNHLGNSYNRGVLVPTAEAEAARAVLEAQAPSDEEIGAALELEATSTEEAEARVR